MSTKISYYLEKLEKFPFPGFFDDITETWQILPKVTETLKQMIAGANVQEMRGEIRGVGPALHGCYFIDEGTVIYNDVTIIGPVYIGKDCEIMPGAIIRPNTIIGDNCSVGHGSEVKHCIMLNGSKVASLAFAGDCVIGASARIGSGVITANRKFNQQNATLKVGNQRVDLGDSFFGCVIGDSSRLGANSVTQPGTHIGPYTWIYPMTCVRGFIPRAKRVYNKAALAYEDNPIVDLK